MRDGGGCDQLEVIDVTNLCMISQLETREMGRVECSFVLFRWGVSIRIETLDNSSVISLMGHN